MGFSSLFWSVQTSLGHRRYMCLRAFSLLLPCRLDIIRVDLQWLKLLLKDLLLDASSWKDNGQQSDHVGTAI